MADEVTSATVASRNYRASAALLDGSTIFIRAIGPDDRERLAAHLMVALYRCGQKSGALAAYTRLRDMTTREFGQDPGPEAQALLRQILADSHELMLRPRIQAAR